MALNEIQPSGTEHAGSALAGESNVRFLYWNGERLIPCSPDAVESFGASQVSNTSPGASARLDQRAAATISDGDALLREFERDGGAEITYWVPVGDGLVPATPEQVERFRENDRELVAQHRLRLWLHEERRRARLHLPRQVALAVMALLASGIRRVRALARGVGLPYPLRGRAAHTEQSVEQVGKQE